LLLFFIEVIELLEIILVLLILLKLDDLLDFVELGYLSLLVRLHLRVAQDTGHVFLFLFVSEGRYVCDFTLLSLLLVLFAQGFGLAASV